MPDRGPSTHPLHLPFVEKRTSTTNHHAVSDWPLSKTSEGFDVELTVLPALRELPIAFKFTQMTNILVIEKDSRPMTVVSAGCLLEGKIGFIKLF